ncbi:hypothetical protein BV20DRAFT_463505 [Pilatotrama ljubarskyi]|nr:hypothetical protein BV20DRAFT_463505 [Pilatotrama ljubarskyi]
MSGKIVIVTYDEMLEQYVPAPTTEDGRHLPEPLQELNQLDFKDVPKPLEKDMYTPLATALNQSWLIGEEYVVRSTPNKADSDVRSNEKVDGGVYRAGNVPPADQERTKWSDIELPIECKTHPTSDDPFEDNEEKKGAPEPMSSDRRKVLGQMMSYASLVFENQHRTHVLTLVVLGKMARIVRWDRSGVIASNKFDYVKEPIKLARFIWRFARLTPELRGHDSTAELVHPGSEDYELMEDRAYRPILHPDGSAVADHARRMFAESLQGNAPRWRLRVGGKDDPHYFLVGAPHFSASGLAGRGTRGYVALDAASPDGPFVYLKDAWRVAHDRIQQEGETLQHLNSDDNGGPVTGVPTLLYHGDVDEQVTESQNAWRRKHPQQPTCPLKTHRHYRLVVKEVGLSMSTFRSVRELVGMLAACIEAHRHAYTRKGYLHRDISAGNVLIYPRPTKMPNGTIKELRVGLLTDWELAKNICDTQEGPRQPDRTGTWQFMSASSLLNTSKRIIVQDDMESFFHILLYFAIRFVPHNCQDVAQFMDIYFDGHTHENGVYFGGEKKLNSMRNGLVTTLKGDVLTFFVRHPPRDLRAANAPSLPVLWNNLLQRLGILSTMTQKAHRWNLRRGFPPS